MVLGYVRTTYEDVRSSTTGKGTVVPRYGLMVASQCEKLSGWSAQGEGKCAQVLERDRDKIEIWNGQSTQGEGRMLRH